MDEIRVGGGGRCVAGRTCRHKADDSKPGQRPLTASPGPGFARALPCWAATGSRAADRLLRFVPETQAIKLAGLMLTIIGCLFAIWARLALGANWSGRATVKADHQLVTVGPYSLARHPIYTGLMVAIVGTAVVVGEVRCLIGVFVILLALMIKMSQEEQLMMQTFPEAYPSYRRRVKALIPGVL